MCKKNDNKKEKSKKSTPKTKKEKDTLNEIKDNTYSEKNQIRKKPQSASKTMNGSKVHTHQKKHKVNYLKQTLQRQMLEEEMIKLTIDKRDKEFQRDCVKKMVLANEYAEKLGVPNSYSAYSEEGENTIICRVFSKTIKDYKDINLKQFLIEFKKLEKCINQQNEREKYKESKDNKEITSSSYNNVKDEEHDEIEEDEQFQDSKNYSKNKINKNIYYKLQKENEIELNGINPENKNRQLNIIKDDNIEIHGKKKPQILEINTESNIELINKRDIPIIEIQKIQNYEQPRDYERKSNKKRKFKISKNKENNVDIIHIPKSEPTYQIQQIQNFKQQRTKERNSEKKRNNIKKYKITKIKDGSSVSYGMDKKIKIFRFRSK